MRRKQLIGRLGTQADAALPSSGRMVLAPIESEASHFPPFSTVVAQIPVRGPREAAPQPTGDESPVSPVVPTPMRISSALGVTSKKNGCFN